MTICLDSLFLASSQLKQSRAIMAWKICVTQFQLKLQSWKETSHYKEISILEFSLHKSPHILDLLLVHLLGNCHVHSFALNSISLGSSNSTLTIISTFYTLHNFSSILCFPLQPTVCLFVSLFISSTLTT